uniref:Putative HNH homing endonuclease n=1 Tax=Golenkinia longispicula TaxID=204992 RepID=A0A0S2ID13_9CHLO|nr:putative HNH homing endonuclease [Golenkinia longispicula]
MSEKMTEIWSKRPKLGLKDKRYSGNYGKWRQDSQKKGNFRCAITGVRPKKLATHHLFSRNSFKSIIYNPQNSITLDHEIHHEFHKIYGFKKPITIDHFLHFLTTILKKESFRNRIFSLAVPRSQKKNKETPTSNQSSYGVSSPIDEGSETRVNQIYLDSPFFIIRRIANKFVRIIKGSTSAW